MSPVGCVLLLPPEQQPELGPAPRGGSCILSWALHTELGNPCTQRWTLHPELDTAPRGGLCTQSWALHPVLGPGWEIPAGLGKAGPEHHFPLGNPFPAIHRHHHPQCPQDHLARQIQVGKWGKSHLDLSEGTEGKLMLCHHCLVSSGAVPTWEKPLEQQ